MLDVLFGLFFFVTLIHSVSLTDRLSPSTSDSSAPFFPDCFGHSNLNPIYTGEPVPVKTVTNGYLLEVGDASLNSTWYIAHLYGTDYDMGKALGEMLTDQIQFFFGKYWIEVVDQLGDDFLGFLPKEIRTLIKKYGINYVLDWLYELTVDFTPKYFFEYIQGIADGAGIEMVDVRRFNYIPQLLNGMCTITGAWGDATPDGNLIQIRTLDEAIPGYPPLPMMHYPTIHVHHYNTSGSSRKVVNINTAGFVGMLAGFNDDGIALSQKWDPGPESSMFHHRPGFMWTFHLFHAMRYSSSIWDSLKIFEEAKRTCSTLVGFGDGKTNKFLGMEYEIEGITLYNWQNQTTFPQHPVIKDVVYWDKEIPPSKSYCWSDLLKYHYGNFTAKTIVRDMISLAETGDMMSVIYDHHPKKSYVSFGRGGSWNQRAFLKQHVEIDMVKIFQNPTGFGDE